MIILGLDVSTNTIGWAISEHITSGKFIIRVIDVGYISLSNHKKNWFAKADQALTELTEVINKYKPDKVQIEENLLGFSPGFTSVQVIVTLARFNGIVSWGIYRLTKKIPLFIHPTTARINAWGTSFSDFKKENKKNAILHKVITKYPELHDKMPKKKNGEYANECWDIADACTLSCCIIKEEE